MAASSNVCGHFSMKTVCSWNPNWNIAANGRHFSCGCSPVLFDLNLSIYIQPVLNFEFRGGQPCYFFFSVFVFLAIKRLQNKTCTFCLLSVENKLHCPLLFTQELSCSVRCRFSCPVTPNNFSLTYILTSIPFQLTLACLVPTDFHPWLCCQLPSTISH